MSEEFENFTEDFLQPSKSRLKKDSAALQDLAAELANLPRTQLVHMELPETMYASVCEAASMPHKSARKRLLKYIAGMLRKMDAEPIRNNLDKIKNQNKNAARELHNIEHWRDRLLTEENLALTELLTEFPQADRQQIRQLIRNAKKEAQSEKPPKSARLLFKNLRTLFDQY